MRLQQLGVYGMNGTIDYYNKNAESFIAGTLHADMSDTRERFLRYVKPKGKVLDAGCGSGRDALAFLKAGYTVHAFDASEEICRIAETIIGIPVECRTFETLSGKAKYDGIWACASLLHVDGSHLPDVMVRLKKLLKDGGILYASFKEGSSERTRDGRLFHDMTEDSCRSLFREAGLNILEVFQSDDVREGREAEKWINIIGRKRS